MHVTTFGELPVDATFQIVWTVPGPMPVPPATTVFTKIAPLTMPQGTANAIYASDDPTMHNATYVPDCCKVLRVVAPVLMIATDN